MQPLNWNNSGAAVMSPPMSLQTKMRWRHAGTGTGTTTRKPQQQNQRRQVLSTVLIAVCNSWLEKDRNNMVQLPGELKMSAAVRLFQEVAFWT